MNAVRCGAAVLAVLALAACGAGSLPQPAQLAQPATVAAIATAAPASVAPTRATTDAVATAGMGALAMPGMGALAMPGMGALAMPGMGALAMPGMGALAMPGLGALALPGLGALALPGGADANAVLADLLNAQPLCTVSAVLRAQAQCNALLNTSIGINANPYAVAAELYGLHPADLQSAYRLPYAGGYGQTVAVIDAGDDPTAESDLAVYRSTFGLPPCTSFTGCFKKVNQSGAQGNYPAQVSGWPQETGVDIEMVSAVCPSCSILLVEANTANVSDLGLAVDTAAALGASAISNSYYAPEYDGELTDETHFNHPGTAITVAAGDTGYGTTFPASSRYVTAVGGTTLARGGARGWTESVWSGTSSGCSAFVPKPAWQHDTGCAYRTVADVAVVGNPQTGVAVYNTTAAASQQGWGVYGGTSVGAPIVAAMYALAGNARSIQAAAHVYASSGSFFAILTGSDGSCSPAYLCTAESTYSGPAGVGSPDGISGL